MIKHISPISGIAAFQGQYVLTAGYDNRVILWDAASRTSLAQGAHDHLANQCAFSDDGTLAASSGSDYSVRIWSLPSMRLLQVLTVHTDDVEGIAFHPNKPWLASCSRDHTLALHDLNGELLQRFEGHKADVISVAWHGHSDTLISSSDDGTIKRWDANTGEMIADIDLGGIETDTIAITNEGVIYAGNDDGEIIIINGDQKRYMQAHRAGIKRLVYDNEQQALVSLSYDRQVKIYNCQEGPKLVHTADLPVIVWPRSCAFLDADNLVFVSFGSSWAQYNYKTATWTLDHIEDTHGVNAVCEYQDSMYTVGDSGKVYKDKQLITELPSLCNFLTPFGDFLLTGGQTGEIFDALTGATIYQHHSPLNCATTFERDGQQLAIIGTYTGEGVVLNLNEQRQPEYLTELHLHSNAIKGICADQDMIFSVSADCGAMFYRIADFIKGAEHRHAHDMIANGCASSDAGRFVSVSRDLKLRIWENMEASVVDTPNQNSIKCVGMSADGEFVVTGNYAGFIGVYQVSSQRWVSWFRPTNAGISSLTRLASGDFVASSYDGNLYTVSVSSRLAEQVA